MKHCLEIVDICSQENVAFEEGFVACVSLSRIMSVYVCLLLTELTELNVVDIKYTHRDLTSVLIVYRVLTSLHSTQYFSPLLKGYFVPK